MSKDYYQVLGVSRQADASELKKAYRRLAMKYHPDRNQGDADAERHFKEVSEAYEVLSDDQRRAAYDRFGHADASGGAGFGGGAGTGGGFSDFGDIFGDIFEGAFSQGARRRESAAYAGSDLEYAMDLTLEESAQGVEKRIRVGTLRSCKTCNGSGARPGAEMKECAACHGVGEIRMQQGFFSVRQTCPQCHGQGRIVAELCAECGGEGRVRKTRELSVQIPAGIDNGNSIRLSGEGEGGARGGPPGDLYVKVRIKPHRLFRRAGANLLLEVPVPLAKAVLGGEVEVPGIDERLRLKVPAGTQNGQQLRLRGKGIKSMNSDVRGDMICHVQIEVPVNLSSEQKDLLKQFDASLANSRRRHTPKTETWLKGVKDFFADISPF